MAKTTINCYFQDAVGNPVDGYILVGVDSWLLKSELAESITNLTAQVDFTAGVCTLQLEPSETEYVTYSFEVYYKKTVTTPDPDTGTPVITITDAPLIPKFYAMVPVSATAINFNQLTKQSGVNRDNIDTALSAIARRLYVEDTFWSRLQENLFVARGYWSSTAWYSRGDVVTYNGGSYLYYNNERTQNTLPTVDTYWQKLADRGLTGAGTTGNDAPFGVSWDGQTDAPSRNAVYDALQNYALTSTVAGLAPLNSPALTGTPLRTVAPASNSNSSELATTAWVQTLITALNKAMTPVGTVVSFAGGSAPTSWVLCDGRTLSRTTYSALFTVLGTTYNTGGEAGTDFRIPDLRGRSILAPDDLGGSAASRSPGVSAATSGGTSTVTLSASQMPVHKHNISMKGFTATGLADAGASGFAGVSFGGVAPTVGLTNQAGNRTAAGDGLGAILDAGGTSGITQSHNNLQPYLSLNYIMYTGV